VGTGSAVSGRVAAAEEEASMRISEKLFDCLKCGHLFQAELVLEAPASVTVASMKAVRCPKCGAHGRYIGLGVRPRRGNKRDRDEGEKTPSGS
jgi:Zn finger protein HypA/HybF involved in hydrogenase expression